MENLKALAYELRENVIDMIVEGKRRAHRRRYERDGNIDRNLF